MKPIIQSLVRIASAAALVLLAPSIAMAHPGHQLGFVAGLTHPLLGVDHLLAILAIGMWAAQLEPRARRAVPATFVLLMVAGAGIGMGQPASAAVELGVVSSVLALGLLIALTIRPALGVAVLMTALFAMLHGYAHGTELPLTASGLTFLAGLSVATVLLQLLGGVAARFADRPQHQLYRWSGAGVAAAGLLLLVL